MPLEDLDLILNKELSHFDTGLGKDKRVVDVVPQLAVIPIHSGLYQLPDNLVRHTFHYGRR